MTATYGTDYYPADVRAHLIAERAARYEREIAKGWRAPIYRDYHITLGEGYTVDTRWQFVHDSYDGDGDRRYGFAETPEACREEIDEIEEGL